jgi:hypothetical protein
MENQEISLSTIRFDVHCILMEKLRLENNLTYRLKVLNDELTLEAYAWTVCKYMRLNKPHLIKIIFSLIENEVDFLQKILHEIHGWVRHQSTNKEFFLIKEDQLFNVITPLLRHKNETLESIITLSLNNRFGDMNYRKIARSAASFLGRELGAEEIIDSVINVLSKHYGFSQMGLKDEYLPKKLDVYKDQARLDRLLREGLAESRKGSVSKHYSQEEEFLQLIHYLEEKGILDHKFEEYVSVQ